MQKLLAGFLVTVLLMSSPAFSATVLKQENSVQIVSLLSQYGLLGVEAGTMLSDRVEVNAGFGVGGDIMYGIGTKVFANKSECYFLKNCQEAYFLQVGVLRNAGGQVTVIENDIESEFDVTSSNFASLGVGSRTILFDTLQIEFLLGYRANQNTPEVLELTETGNEEAKSELESWLASRLVTSISAGFSF